MTEVDTVLLLPLASSTVPLTRYVPAILKTCVTAAVPVTAPKLCTPLPSPQLTLKSRTAEPLVAAAVITNENVAGSPALGAVVGGVMTSVGAAMTPTVTVPEAWPGALPVAGAVGVVGLVGVVGVVGAVAPTLAVTVAVWDVLSVVCA